MATQKGLMASLRSPWSGVRQPVVRLNTPVRFPYPFRFFDSFLLNHRLSLALLFIIFSSLIDQGCSFSYVDSQGYKHIMGLVDVKIKTPTSDSNPDSAQNIDVTSVGIAFYRNPLNSGLAIGYNREGVTVLEGDNCVAVADDSNQGEILKPLTEKQMIHAFERIPHENK